MRSTGSTITAARPLANPAGPRASRQVLHQPYRRHLLTTGWVTAAVAAHGFRPVAERHRPYLHTRVPSLNLPTIDWYLDRHGGLGSGAGG